MFDNILVASDVLVGCDAAVAAAARLAGRSGGRLHVIHVLESAYSGIYRNYVKHFETGEEIVSGADYEKAVRDRIAAACAETLAPLDRWDIRVTPGLPFEKILEWAREKTADLIVLGPHSERARSRGVARYIGRIGSTVEGVIRRAHCVVMIVNRPLPPESDRFRRIMVCVDFSESCRYALQMAVRLAETESSRLHVFHMLHLPAASAYPQDELEADIADLTDRLKAFCRVPPRDLDAEFTVWEGAAPHQEILKFAREREIDLIAMGSHTKEKGDKWYVGSAAEQVASRALCPVAVVTDPKAVKKLV